jgi:hypothetical protein
MTPLTPEETQAQIQMEEEVLEIIDSNLGSLVKQMQLQREVKLLMALVRDKQFTPRTPLAMKISVFQVLPNPARLASLDRLYFKLADDLMNYFKKIDSGENIS